MKMQALNSILASPSSPVHQLHTVRRLRYDESAKVMDSKLDSKRVIAHLQIVRAVHALDSKLSFTKSTVSEAIKTIAESPEKQHVLKLDPTLQTDWIETLTRRFRTRRQYVRSPLRLHHLRRSLSPVPASHGPALQRKQDGLTPAQKEEKFRQMMLQKSTVP